MRRFLGLTTTLACSAALLLGAIGPASAQAVTPASFAKQVCTAVATANQSGKAPSAALKAAAQAYKASPSATTATGVRDAMTQAIQNLDQQLSTVLTAIQQNGAPASATAFVGALTSNLESQRTAAEQLAQHSAAVDTTTPSAFATGFQQVLDETKTIAAQARASAKADPAFLHVARPLQPIVHLLTTKADTCTKG
ncbi:MAG TPA: hypothetical protein VGN51_13965 [Acidimicrobiia bacterium]|jgi:hypothetical protein